jgi:outer membrane immunogenic protein
MKTAIFAAMSFALATSVTAPAFAQDTDAFTGPHIGVTGGYDSFNHDDGVTYGVNGGFDLALLPRVTGGVEVSLADSTTNGPTLDASRDLATSLRLGYVVTPKILAFGKLGYASSRFEAAGTHSGAAIEGVRFGGGLEYALSPKTYISAEYQRSEYESDVGGRDAGLIGVGFRF